MEFQMRNKTFISSMVLSVACVSAANAAVTFDSFTVVQSETNGAGIGAGINWASPASSQPIFGASGTRAAFAYLYGNSGTVTSSVSGGTATFSATNGGGAGLYYSGSAQDLTGYNFSLNLNMTGPTNSFNWSFKDAGGGDVDYRVNYTVAGTYTIDLSHLSQVTGIDPSTITSMAISIYSPNYPCSATVSNFTYAPAPGAVALLGAAGLVGARRRRA
jgi:hypothetical protein